MSFCLVVDQGVCVKERINYLFCSKHSQEYEKAKELEKQNFRYALLCFFYATQDIFPNEIKEEIYSYCVNRCTCYACLNDLRVESPRKLFMFGLGFEDGYSIMSDTKISSLDRRDGTVLFCEISVPIGEKTVKKVIEQCNPLLTVGHYERKNFHLFFRQPCTPLQISLRKERMERRKRRAALNT